MSLRRWFRAASPERMKPWTRKKPMVAWRKRTATRLMTMRLIFSKISAGGTAALRLSTGFPMSSLRK